METTHFDGVVVQEPSVEYSFDKLNVYQRSLNWVDQLFDVCDKLDWTLQNSMGSQLRRAAVSVVNHIAEGSDKKSIKERVLFYSYALGSARETVPMVTLLLRRKMLEHDEHVKLRNECTEICRMLNGLINGTLRMRVH